MSMIHSDKKKESWRKIASFPNYKVSSKGRIKSQRTIMTPYTTKNGYKQIRLFSNGKHHSKYVHRLVAEAFIDRDNDRFEVNHIDGNKANNSVENLEWCTHSENTRHAIKKGLFSPYKLPINPHPKRRVRIVETGDVFDSVTECATYIGGNKSGVSACLCGKAKSYKGFHFEEI